MGFNSYMNIRDRLLVSFCDNKGSQNMQPFKMKMNVLDFFEYVCLFPRYSVLVENSDNRQTYLQKIENIHFESAMYSESFYCQQLLYPKK